LGDEIKEDEMAADVARMGNIRNAHKILVRKPQVKNHFGDIETYGKIISK